MSLDIGFASQTPSLPDSGGSLGGLGETFVPDLSMGTGTMTVPLDIPNGPNDIAPKLFLRYGSSNPNSVYGLGWDIALPRILRSSNHGVPAYNDDDSLVLEGSGPLVRMPDGSFRPEVETGEWRIEVMGDGFLVTDRAGTQYELGLDSQSRISSGSGTWAWLLHRIVDNLGNAASFNWISEGSQRYLDEVSYGPYAIKFTYETRPDPLRYGRAGFLLETLKRCSKISLNLTADAQPIVREWEIGYVAAEPSGVSLLSSVTLTGHDATGGELTAPPLTFDYSTPAAPTLKRIASKDTGAMPPALSGDKRVDFIDWNGNGLPDIIEFGTGGTGRLWANRGGVWDRPQFIGGVPELSDSRSQVGMVDLNGDGLADIIRIDRPLSGFQPRNLQGLDRPVTWQQAPVATPGSANSRLADFDGDGVLDMIWSSGNALLIANRTESGWSSLPEVIPSTVEGPPTDLSDPHVYCADMTGDGTPDMVRADGTGVTYWPYLGKGVFGDPIVMQTPPNFPFNLDPQSVFLADIDGNGCADVIHLSKGRVRWWPNRMGDGFEPEREILHVPTGAMQDVRIADIHGLGVQCLCWSTVFSNGRSQWFSLDLLGGVSCSKLSSISNGVGKVTEVTYGSSSAEAERDREAGAAWPGRLPIVLPVVKQIDVRDQITDTLTRTQFNYHNGRYDGVLREVCGFGHVDAIEVGDEHVDALTTTRWFHIGTLDNGDEPDTTEQRSLARAIRGRIKRVERRSGSVTLFDTADTEWRVDLAADGLTYTPRLVSSLRSVFEGASEPVNRIFSEQLAWDVYGNITRARERTFDGLSTTPVSELNTHTEYAVDTNNRFRQRVWRMRQTDGNNKLLAETRTQYDGLADGLVGNQGLVTMRTALAIPDELAAEVYDAEQPDFTSLGYVRKPGITGWWIDLGTFQRSVDAAGIHGVITGPRGGVSELDLDATGCYPVRTKDAIGHELTAQFDLRSYQAVSVTPPSGNTSHANFDALARLTAVAEPGDSLAQPTVSYAYDTSTLPSKVTFTQRTDDASAPITVEEFLDGEGRLLERRRVGVAEQITESTHVYGLRGLLYKTYLPHLTSSTDYVMPSEALPHSRLHYDALARLHRTVRPDGAIASVRYLPGVIEERDEESHRDELGAQHKDVITRRVLDSHGRVVRTEQQNGSESVVTTDEFDLKGSVVKHTDATGATTEFKYDLLGRVLQVSRPEASQIAVLDVAGNIVESRSGAAKLFREFDLNNRPVSIRHDSATASPSASYIYHDLGAGPADSGAGTSGGQLVRIDDEAGTTIFDYDERGNITSKNMRPNGAPEAKLTMQYRSDGRIQSMAYPDGSTVDYQYNVYGQLASMPGVVDSIEYDLAGRKTVTRYANGTQQVDAHNPLTGWRVGSILSANVPAGTNILRAVQYSHDLVGNLLSIDSSEVQSRWSYNYDNLYRLITASNATDDWSYAYDASGNLISHSDHGSFNYGEQAPQTCLTSAGSDQFEYNDRGHVTSAPWGTHQIDAEGRLRRIDLTDGGHEELTYTHSGKLARKQAFAADGTSTSDSISLDDFVRFENGEFVFHFNDGSRTVAREVGGAKTWLHVDHLGSLVLATDSNGTIVLDIRYGPYGTILSQNGETIPQGFATGQPMSAGLVLLGARWYCPQIGRFLSPDPMVGDAGDPIAWNAYAYALCNPVSFIDPTGRNGWKIFGAILATIAIVALVVVVSVFTFGVASPGAVAFGVGGISVTWGAVFAATMVGIAAGGVIGGIAAARAGGDAMDIALGVLVGGAVGGWAAFGAAFAGPAVAGAFGLSSGTVLGGAVAGGVSGAINGAAMGFASGFAGGKNNGFADVMQSVLIGAIVGLAIGAALGALSGVAAPKKSLGDSVGDALQPKTPSAPVPGSLPANGPATASPVPINSIGEAGKTIAGKLAGKVAGAAFPHVAAATAGFTGSIITQTVLVNASAAFVSEYWEEIERLARTGSLDFGPISVGGKI